MPIGHQAVKARRHQSTAHRLAAQAGIGRLLVHGAVHAEFHPIGGVHELEIQIGGHQLGGEILAPADQFVLGDAFLVQPGLQVGKFRFQVQLDAQFIPNLQIPGGDHVEHLSAVHPVAGVGVAEIEQVRDFMVVFVPLSGGGDHHYPAVRVGEDNVPHLPVLVGGGHGGPAEFRYFQHVSIPSFPSGSAQRNVPG